MQARQPLLLRQVQKRLDREWPACSRSLILRVLGGDRETKAPFEPRSTTDNATRVEHETIGQLTRRYGPDVVPGAARGCERLVIVSSAERIWQGRGVYLHRGSIRKFERSKI